MKGWGPKSSVCPSKPREIKLFWREIPGFCRDIPASARKDVWVQFLAPSLRNSEIGGCKETLCQPFANPSPTLRQPFANPLPTFRQPFANLFCQPLSKPLFPWTPGTGSETQISSLLGVLYKFRVTCGRHNHHRNGKTLRWPDSRESIRRFARIA